MPLGDPAWAVHEAAEPVQLELTSTERGLQLDVTFSHAVLQQRGPQDQPWTRLTMPGLGTTTEPGTPALPTLRRFLHLPAGASAGLSVSQLTVTRLDVVEIDLRQLALPATLEPVQAPQPKCSCKQAAFTTTPDRNAYRGTVAAPPALTPMTMRGHGLALIAVSPVQYLPEQGLLRIASRLRIGLELAGGGAAATDQRLASPHFDSLVEQIAIASEAVGSSDPATAKSAGWAYPSAAPVSMLLISHPDLAGGLQPFVDWKTTCGYQVTLVTTTETGETADQIKAYLREQYQGPQPPVYVILVGDAPELLPTFETGNAIGGTDLPYVQMDDDLLPDMMIARWPVDDLAELVAMRDKILRYEQPLPGVDWLDRALFIGGDDYSSRGWTTHQDVISGLLQAPPNQADAQLWDGASGRYQTADLVAGIDNGLGWVVYSAHADHDGWAGRPAFTSDDLRTLGNTGRYPVAISHACRTNMWSADDDGFGELAVTLPERGFVAFWGASADTFWTEDDWLERGFFDALLDRDLPGNLYQVERQHSLAAACYAGLTEVTLRGTGVDRYYWEVYNLNGDPSLDPYTRRPLAMLIDAPEAVPPSPAEPFPVQVASSDGTPLAGALVGVSQQGTLLAAGFTNAHGRAELTLDRAMAGVDLLVRVTAHNHLPADRSAAVGSGNDGKVVLDAGVYRCDSTVTINLFDSGLKGFEPAAVILGSSVANTTRVELPKVLQDDAHFRGSVSLGKHLVVGNQQTLTVSYRDLDVGNLTSSQKQDTAIIDCAGPEISGLRINRSHSSARISFTTDEAATAEVLYGPDLPLRSVVANHSPSLQHHLSINRLRPCTRYLLRVRTTDALGNQRESKYYKVITEDWQSFLSESLDSDPGWAINNAGSGAQGWGFGEPSGLEQDGFGGPDPVAGATGANVYGLNLDGDAPASIAGMNELTLTTPPINLATAGSVELRYRRWLGVEASQYDHARILLSVDGGVSWQVVWENGKERIDDRSWTEHAIKLPAAARHSQVLLRWSYGSSDDTWQGCGWNIDDIVVEGQVRCDSSSIFFVDGFEPGDARRWAATVE